MQGEHCLVVQSGKNSVKPCLHCKLAMEGKVSNSSRWNTSTNKYACLSAHLHNRCQILLMLITQCCPWRVHHMTKNIVYYKKSQSSIHTKMWCDLSGTTLANSDKISMPKHECNVLLASNIHLFHLGRHQAWIHVTSPLWHQASHVRAQDL